MSNEIDTDPSRAAERHDTAIPASSEAAKSASAKTAGAKRVKGVKPSAVRTTKAKAAKSAAGVSRKSAATARPAEAAAIPAGVAPAPAEDGLAVRSAKPAGEKKKDKKVKRKAGAHEKVVRDSFTMPKDDHALIAELKAFALANGASAKKSEILRAGLRMLAGLPEKKRLAAIQAVERIRTGRPS